MVDFNPNIIASDITQENFTTSLAQSISDMLEQVNNDGKALLNQNLSALEVQTTLSEYNNDAILFSKIVGQTAKSINALANLQ